MTDLPSQLFRQKILNFKILNPPFSLVSMAKFNRNQNCSCVFFLFGDGTATVAMETTGSSFSGYKHRIIIFLITRCSFEPKAGALFPPLMASQTPISFSNLGFPPLSTCRSHSSKSPLAVSVNFPKPLRSAISSPQNRFFSFPNQLRKPSNFSPLI